MEQASAGAAAAIYWRQWPAISLEPWDGSRVIFPSNGAWLSTTESVIGVTADMGLTMKRAQVKPNVAGLPYWVIEYPIPAATPLPIGPGFWDYAGAAAVPVKIREEGVSTLNQTIECPVTSWYIGSIVNGYPVLSVRVEVLLGITPAAHLAAAYLAATYPTVSFQVTS